MILDSIYLLLLPIFKILFNNLKTLLHYNLAIKVHNVPRK